MARTDITGRRFGRLTALECVGSKNNQALWRCLCDCGKQADIIGSKLRRGHTRSCGCLQREKAAACFHTHGQMWPRGLRRRMMPEYRSWIGMIRRCTEPNGEAWGNYGGRGITVCKRWRDSFENFLADMGKKPSRLRSLDRFPDMNGDYEPMNCRWATPEQQANNRRTNRFIRIGGDVMTFSEGVRRFSVVGAATARARYNHGWSADQAFFTPLCEKPAELATPG